MRIVILVGSLVMAACAARGLSTPEGTLEAYRQALSSGDTKRAYALMSSDFKASVSPEQFAAMIKENKKLVKQTERHLRSPKEVRVIAEYEYGYGESLRFVRKGGKWRLVSNPIDYYADQTPRQALRSFVRAFKNKRWDIMLRFVPARYRSQMTDKQLKEQFSGKGSERLRNKMLTLEANLGEPIVERGDEANMTYGDMYNVVYNVVLVRESGGWKIKDLD